MLSTGVQGRHFIVQCQPWTYNARLPAAESNRIKRGKDRPPPTIVRHTCRRRQVARHRLSRPPPAEPVDNDAKTPIAEAVFLMP